jgi:hypothetical protein
LVFDKSSALVVADATLPGVEIFPRGSLHASKTFGQRGSPRFAQLDENERHLFVTDTARNAVEEYDYPSGALANVVTSGLKSVYGVALSPRAPL